MIRDVEMKEVYDYDCVGFLLSRISVYVIYYSQYYIDSNPSFRLVEFIFSCLLFVEGGRNLYTAGAKKKKKKKN